MIYEDCPDRVEIRAFDSTVVRYLCGCSRCPRPDPTPTELQARIDRAWIEGNLGLVSR